MGFGIWAAAEQKSTDARVCWFGVKPFYLQLFIWFVGWNFFYTTAVLCPRPRSLRSRGFREFARGFPKGTPMGKLRDRDLDYELWDEVLLFGGWPQVEEIAFQKSLGYLVMMAQNRPQWARNENCMLKPFFTRRCVFSLQTEVSWTNVRRNVAMDYIIQVLTILRLKSI